MQGQYKCQMRIGLMGEGRSQKSEVRGQKTQTLPVITLMALILTDLPVLNKTDQCDQC